MISGPIDPLLTTGLPGPPGLWIALFLLALACLAAGEYVLLRLRRRRRRPPEFVGGWRQLLCGRLLNDLGPALGAARLGWITAAVLLGAIGVEASAGQPAAWRWATLPGLALLALLLTQVARKAVAGKPAGREPLAAILPVFLLALAMAPILRLGEAMSSLAAKLLGSRPADDSSSEEELRSILTSSSGPELGEPKLALLDNVFELSPIARLDRS